MNIFIFILWFILSELIIQFVRFLLRKINIKICLDILIIIFEIVGSIAVAYIVMAGPIFFRPVQPFLLAFYVALMMDGVAKLIYLIINLFMKKTRNSNVLSTISSLLGIAFLIFGIVNVQTVNAKYLTFESNKLHNEYKVAFISDLHIGSSQPTSVSVDTINKIKSENPDYVFIGGDIVDIYTTKDDMEEVISTFKDFTIPVYFIYGNHDKEIQSGVDVFEDCLIKNNINILHDGYTKLSNDLTLLTRNDLSLGERQNIDELENPYPGTYVLAVDHQPFSFKDNCKAGVDLQLSGHTHAGQLFPLNAIYSFAVKSYGTFYEGDSIINVSSGASGWRVPLRTDIGCEYKIITLKPLN